MPFRRWPRVWIRLAILIALAVAAWYTIRFDHVWRVLAQGRPGYLAIALVLAATDRLVMGYKWRQLITAAGGRIPFAAVVSAYFQSTFVGHVIPSAVTSEIFRCYLVCRRGLDRSTALLSMAAERIIGAGATVALALAAAPVVGVNLARTSFPWSAGAAAVIAAAICGVIVWRLRARVVRQLASLAERLAPSKLWEAGNLGSLLAVSFVLALGEQLLQVTIVLFVAAALDIVQWSPAFFAALVVITSVRRVVAYVESWGLAEGVSIGLYVAVGIDPSSAAALAIATYVVLVVSVIPGGILLLTRSPAERWPQMRAA